MKKLTTLIIGLTLSAPLSAESMFRCTDSSFAHTGDSSAKVRMKCGPPEFKEGLSGGGSIHNVETWTYRNPYNEDMATALTFRNGVLKKIEGLGRIN